MKNQNTNKAVEPSSWSGWTRKDSEALVALYLMDYFRTLDDYYLEEAVAIARDDGVDLERIMRRIRFQQA